MTRATLAILAVGLFAAGAHAQNIPRDGTEILRGLLKYNGLSPVERVGRNPGGTLVVVVGSVQDNGLLAEVRQTVLQQGGALLVITDEPIFLQGYLPAGPLDRSARMTNSTVHCTNANNCFDGRPASPLLQLQPGDPTRLSLVKQRNPAATLNLATRSPHTVLNAQQLDASFLSVEVAKFPLGSEYVGVKPDADVLDATLALMSDPDDRLRTVMVYANRAMFTNGLMTARDARGNATDNFAYAFLLTKYLAERLNAGGGPKECLFLEDGQPNTDFDRVTFAEQKGPQLPPGAFPKIPVPLLADMLLDKGNEWVAQVEDRDIPNVLQQRDVHNHFQDNWLYGVAILGTIVLSRYLLARSWSLRQVPDVSPRLRIDPERGGGLIPERRLALLQSGNLYEPLRDHLRLVFQQWGVTAPAAEPPPIATDRKTRPRTRIVTDLFRLWEIAYSPRRTPVTPDDMEELEEMIADLASAHKKGIWRFAAAGGAA